LTRVFNPVLFEIRNGKPRLPRNRFKKLPLTQKTGFYGGQEQAFAKAAGPSQKIGVTLAG
jgi:hypothetical protein